MLDLDSPELLLPPYKIKVRKEEHEYDALLLGYKMKVVEGVTDPTKILEAVNEVFELKDLNLSAFEGYAIAGDFGKFWDEIVEPLLKKVARRSPSSDTTTDSTPEKSES